MSKLKKSYILIILIWLLGLIAVIWICRNRMYLRTFEPDELAVSDELAEGMYIDEILDTVTVSGSESGVIETDGMAFDAGTYVFAMSYSTDHDGDVFQVISDTAMDADGNVGKSYAQITMLQSENRVRAEITFNSDVTDVHIRVLHKSGSLTITEIVWRNTKTYLDPVIMYLLWSLAVAAALMFMHKCGHSIGIDAFRDSRVTDALIILLLAILATFPYFNDFLIRGHDLNFHLSRIEGIAKALRLGQFPGWINPVANSSYGYSSSIMYPQLFLYIPALLHACGLSLMNSYKVLVFMINLMASGCGYIGLRGVLKNRYAGILGSALWCMSLYRLDGLYIRAAIGEALAMAFLPLLFWALYELLFRDSSKWWLATIAFSCVIESHLLSTEIYLTVAVVFFIICMLRMKDRLIRLRRTLYAAGLFLLCNLFYIVPFLTYYLKGMYNKTNAQLASVYLQDRTVYFSQLFNTFSHIAITGKGNIAAGTTVDEMPLSIGLIPVIGLVIICMTAYRFKDNRNEKFKLMVVSEITAVILTFAACWLIPWDVLIKFSVLYKMASTVQFLWRFLGIISFFTIVALTAAVEINLSGPHLPDASKKMMIIAGGCIIAIIFGWPAVDTATQIKSYPGKEYIAFNRSVDYLYLHSDGDLAAVAEQGDRVLVSDTDARVTSYSKKGTEVECVITSNADLDSLTVTLPVYYYPGYKVYVNGEETAGYMNDSGILSVDIPNVAAGSEITVSDSFCPSWTWIAAYVISILAAAAWIAVYFAKKKRQPEMI